jgi:hypothetical protein
MNEPVIPPWFVGLAQRCNSIPIQRGFQFGGIEFKLRAELGDAEWLELYLAPAIDAHPRSVPKVTYTLTSLTSDLLLAEIVRSQDSDQTARTLHYRRQFVFGRMRFEGGRSVDYFPELGIAWISDLSTQSLCIVRSSRTQLPAIELARGALELVYRFLLADSWCVYHAGAVQIDNRAYLLVGDSGAGKTTLLLTLIAGGARYVSNERVLVKKSKGVLFARPFPQPVGIGLGTAMRFPELAPLIQRPDRLIHPQYKFDAQRVWSTSPEKWSELPDKLKVLPHELEQLFSVSSAASEVLLTGIIVPRLQRDATEAALQPLDEDCLTQILDRNSVLPHCDTVYPSWLPLHFKVPTEQSRWPSTTDLCGLPSIELTFPTKSNGAILAANLMKMLAC